MHYTRDEIELAKILHWRTLARGATPRIGIVAVALSSRPSVIHSLGHDRTWRDYLRRARRELRALN